MSLEPKPSLAAAAPQAQDLESIRRAQQGDVAAFAEIYDRHAPAALALGQHMLASIGDAQDLLHDVFIEAWQHVREYDPERGSVRTWLLMRMRSRALDRLDRRARERLVQRALASAAGASERPRAERELALRQALAGLDEGARSALELTYFWGLTAGEISERLSVPEGTIRSRLARGLLWLERTLSEREGATNER